MIALGVALVVSSFLGGRRWLVLPALVLAIPLGFVAAAGFDVNGGVGDRDYQPTTRGRARSSGYKLGIGQMRLDLTQVDLPPGRTPLKLDMGIGSVRMVVPDDVCVASKVRVGAGYARVLDRDSGGLDVDWRQSPAQNGGVKRLVIDGDVGIGELQVVNSRSALRQLGPALPLRPEVQLRRERPGRPASEQQRQRRLRRVRVSRASIPPRSSPGS